MKDISVQLIYNPQKSSVEILEKTLTQDRAIIADHFCSVMEELVKNGTTHHDLIIGPRGSGKTHVLAYICKKFLKNNAESQIKIISLSEEDRSISSSLDLLVSILRSSNQVMEEEIQSQLNKVHPREALVNAETIFQNITKKQPTILIIENLNDIFSNLKQGGQRDFRGFLQSNPYIVVLSSSCRLFKDSGHHDHPFHGFFHIQPLGPLNLSDAQSYLIALARINKKRKLVEVLKEENARKRVAAIYGLTGGNHRLLAMLSGFLTPEGFEELVEPFIKMVDRELTPYYQQRLDRLAPQQNKVLQAIVCLGDGAFSVKEIARHSLLSSQIVSRHLHDLLHGGYVRRERRGRYSFYELNEPLLRIVLEMKQVGHQPLPTIVELLRYWYEAEELIRLEAIAPEYAKEYYRAALKIEPVALDEVPRIGGDGVSLGEFEQKEQALAVTGQEDELLEEGIAFLKKRDYQEAIKTFDKVVERFGGGEGTELLEQVAMALVNKGVALGQLEHPEDAITVYDEVVERFGGSEETELLELVAMALFNKGIVLGQLERPEDAITVYDEVVEWFGGSEETDLLELVAMSLFNRGIVLGQLERPEDEIAAYDDVVERFSDSEETELLVSVARALVNKGVTLRRFNRPEDAIAVYDIVVERFSDSEETELLEPVAKALFNKGIVLGQLERPEDEIAVYDEVVERFSDTEEPELLEQIAKALFNKGIVLGQLERPEDAITVYDDVVERFSDSEETELLVSVARALVNKGVALRRLNRPEDAITAYDEVVERFGGSEETELLVQVARALINKGVALGELERPEDEITVYDDVVERFGGCEETELLEPAAMALVNKGIVLGENDQLNEAFNVFCDVITRFGGSRETPILEQVTKALFNKGKALGLMNQPFDQILVYDEVVSRFRGSEVESFSQSAFEAMNKKAVVLTELEQLQEALDVYDSVLDESADNLIANYGRIHILIMSGRMGEAISDLKHVVSSSPMSESRLAALAYFLLEEYADKEPHLQKIAGAFLNQDAAIPLVNGLISWFKELLPLSKADAEGLAGTEKTLRELLADEPLAEHLLSMLKAALEDAKGDQKALLALPLELRRLIQREKGEEPDN